MTATIATIITVTSCACSVIITGLLMIGTAFGGNMKEKVNRRFFAALFFNAIGSCFEALATLLTGQPGQIAVPLLWIADFFSYAFGGFVAISFTLYVYEYLSIKRKVSKAPFTFIVYCMCINIIVIAAGMTAVRFALLNFDRLLNPQIFPIFAQILPMIILLLLIGIALNNAKYLRPREWMSLVIYSAMPIVCYIIEYIFIAYPFWITYFGASVVLLLLYINIQVELSHTLIKKEAELAESRTAIMLSQIQPHFLFNSLTAIGKLCDLDPKRAKTAVTDFADYLRGNLESVGKRKLTGFIDELEHIEAYLALEQLRYKDRLRVSYEITVQDFVLPPLTVQPIVENAVQHGLMEKEAGGTVRIRTEAGHDSVRITVSDDGVGFDPAAQIRDGRTHVGIENVRERLSALCGGNLTIQSTKGIGTTATITVPYHTEKEDVPCA